MTSLIFPQKSSEKQRDDIEQKGKIQGGNTMSAIRNLHRLHKLCPTTRLSLRGISALVARIAGNFKQNRITTFL